MAAKFRENIYALARHQGFRRYFANTSWLFVEKFLRLGVGFFVGVWVARYLGPERYGLLSYAQAFVGLFTAIAGLGLDGILVRELVKHPEKEGELLGSALVMKLFGAILTIFLVGIAIHLTNSDRLTKILVFIIASSVIFQSFNVIDLYFQAKVQAKYAALANMMSLFASSVLKIYLILSHAPLIYFAFAVLFDSFVLACGYLWWFFSVKRKEAKEFISELKFRFDLAKGLLRGSKFILFSSAVLMIQAYIDQVMINNFLGSKEVGYYSVAMRLIAIFGFVPMMLKASLYPAIQKAKTVSETLYKNRLLNFYRLNFLLFIIIAVPIFIFADKIVIIIFGEEYHPAGILLSLMAIRLFFTNMGVARSCFILSENLLKFSFLTMTLGTLTNIILNYYWIPVYEAKGAIIATIVSFFVTIFAIDIFYRKTRKNVILQFKALVTFHNVFKDLGTSKF